MMLALILNVLFADGGTRGADPVYAEITEPLWSASKLPSLFIYMSVWTKET